MSRTHAAAFCAVLSTAAIAGMAATIVLAGDHACDVSGCGATAAFAVTSASGPAPVPPATAACTPAPGSPTATTPPMADDPPRPACAPPAAEPLPAGGMITGRAPAP